MAHEIHPPQKMRFFKYYIILYTLKSLVHIFVHKDERCDSYWLLTLTQLLNEVVRVKNKTMWFFRIIIFSFILS